MDGFLECVVNYGCCIVSSDAIREYLVDAKGRSAIDFGCGTGLVGMYLLKEFNSMLFLDTSQNMINPIKQKISDLNIQNADTLCFDFEKEGQSDIHDDYIFMAQVLLHINDVGLVLSRLYDVLNPGGHLLIVDFNKNEEIISYIVHNGLDRQEYILISAGAEGDHNSKQYNITDALTVYNSIGK